jgi:hypothetical protein
MVAGSRMSMLSRRPSLSCCARPMWNRRLETCWCRPDCPPRCGTRRALAGGLGPPPPLVTCHLFCDLAHFVPRRPSLSRAPRSRRCTQRSAAPRLPPSEPQEARPKAAQHLIAIGRISFDEPPPPAGRLRRNQRGARTAKTIENRFTAARVLRPTGRRWRKCGQQHVR